MRIGLTRRALSFGSEKMQRRHKVSWVRNALRVLNYKDERGVPTRFGMSRK
jgi:hypothetical protein